MANKVVRFVVPAKGLRVICPELNAALPAGGAEKVMSPYWHKRAQEGDVFLFKNKSAATKASKTSRGSK